MANIRLNGQNNTNNVTCFSYAPTILEVSSVEGGTKTYGVIMFGSTFNLEGDGHYVEVNGVRLTNVTEYNKAEGYKFYLTTTSSDLKKRLMVNSLCEALRRVPSIASDYDVFVDRNNQMSIIINARHIGNRTLSISTDIPFITKSVYSGSASTEFKDGHLMIDVYKAIQKKKYNYTQVPSYNYVTTLSKKTNNDYKVKFDLGSVFASLTDEGDVSQFGLKIYRTDEDGIIDVAWLPSIFNVNGYLINQGGEFIPQFQNAKIAMNAHRGANRNFLNNTILYVYEPSIHLSVYAADNVSSIGYKVKYIGSDNSVMHESALTSATPNPLNHLQIALADGWMKDSKYIDIEFTDYNLGTLRYNVIKPVKNTDEIQRIYWYNSWGGVSFWDFTGNRTEERKLTTTTYQDSILDYYDNNINEKDYVYNKINEISVNLSTHNIHKDGQWALFDLQQSRTAWTWVNGEKYRIIIEDLTINETSVSDIYTATIRYKYSMGVNA